ncbi:hypothetical protein GUITHDRAFT_154135 [Guillardia theta CCMP2712]|uniref:alanine--glyoxylate transaminase n=3 Tax=Guillardia theta TaxID=55529 RepID=L1IW50_GUITC|nr:hypothetical protein GUITHDRAFT_154135 [Guillardia theta CCMP2712]EKX40466.1 hypothetical protein GUITHDRAFT_154135 [Guillardia theta CCMP2712]|mmetsp:Transcript_41899/g.132103  ORF Transcript_41899/g.132103 Transcript_41899/m.132103 type:complete len:429 (+) Transcript_41899:38-1324(+)|eukprot:XP_005827446.1 hypothetical protein GUITHDRAFT_154135 [Guillardia theta CCMP2712]
MLRKCLLSAGHSLKASFPYSRILGSRGAKGLPSSRAYGSLPIGGYESESVRPKLFIPGPVEFSPEVLQAAGSGARAHTDTTLIEDFGRSIELVRKVFLSSSAQPFILSGSGVLGWDVVACNLLRRGDRVLQVNSGFFSTRFEDAYKQYGMEVTSVAPKVVGARPLHEEVEKELKGAKQSSRPYKIISITGVDTSTGVLADLKALCELTRSVSPDTLIVVDAVCSAAGEELRMDEWGIDFVLTGSQKAIGVPPGLCVMICSQQALERIPDKAAIPNYFANLRSWMPIMESYEKRKPSYFATPAVNLVGALRVGLEQLLETPGGMDGYFDAHRRTKDRVHKKLSSAGLQLLTESSQVSSNLLSCIRYPQGKAAGDILPPMKERGWIIAAGLHPACAGEYFRVGHMGYSVTKRPEWIDKLTDDLVEIACSK